RRPPRRASGLPLAWAEAVARDRHAARARPEGAARRRTRRWHDPSGDRSHGGAVAEPRRKAHRRRRRARYGLRAQHRSHRHGVARRQGARRRVDGQDTGRPDRHRGLSRGVKVTVLQIEKLNQFYGESHTLWDISREVPEGGCLCLMGRNGVGKTTLLKSVMGSVASTGTVKFAGTSLLNRPQFERARAGIGLVPQGREIFGQLTVEENLL